MGAGRRRRGNALEGAGQGQQGQPVQRAQSALSSWSSAREGAKLALLRVASALRDVRERAARATPPPGAAFSDALLQLVRSDEALRKKVVAALELRKVVAESMVEHYSTLLRRGGYDLRGNRLSTEWIAYKLEAWRAELRALDEACRLLR